MLCNRWDNSIIYLQIRNIPAIDKIVIIGFTSYKGTVKLLYIVLAFIKFYSITFMTIKFYFNNIYVFNNLHVHNNAYNVRTII